MTSRPTSARSSGTQSRSDFNVEVGSLAHEDLAYAWKPGIWAQFPWQGLGSLILVVLLTAASVGIVGFSHDSQIEKWRVGNIRVQPQVWLAIFSTIINALLAFAFTNGTNVHFWKRASRGTTLRELHDIYESTAILGAAQTLLQGGWNVVVIACIMMTACMARDPFFQRALVVENVPRRIAGAADIRSALFVPDIFPRLETLPDPSDPLRQILLSMFADAIPYDTSNIPCSDGCTSSLKGFGFEPVCNSGSYNYDISDALTASVIASDDQLAPCGYYWGYDDVIEDKRLNGTYCNDLARSFVAPQMTAYELEYDAREYEDVERQSHEYKPFKSDDIDPSQYSILDQFAGNDDYSYVSPITEQPGEIRITTKFKDMSTCKGVAQTRTCTLHQGVIDYAVILRNGNISLRYPHWQNDTFLHKYERQNQSYITKWLEVFSTLNPADRSDLRHSTLNDIFEQIDYVNCNDWKQRPASNMSCVSSVSRENNFAFRAKWRFRDLDQKTDESGCSPWKWRDPIQDVLDDIRNFTFRFSLKMAHLSEAGYNTDWMARTSNWTQRVEFHDGIRTQTVYKANWSFVAAAVIFSLVGVLSVTSLFWGWWELGRPVSLNPLEVGMAFDSPIFSSVNSNSHRSQIIRTMGPRQVKYGGQVLKPLKRVSMSHRASMSQRASMSHMASMSQRASVNHRASMNQRASMKQRGSMSQKASVNESAFVSENTLMSGSGSASINAHSSTAESALMNETSGLVNEGGPGPSTSTEEENEPMVAFKTQLSRLRMELRKDFENADDNDENWVITPRPGDVFS